MAYIYIQVVYHCQSETTVKFYNFHAGFAKPYAFDRAVMHMLQLALMLTHR